MVDNSTASQSRSGLLYGLAAYGWWGLMPLYFNAVKAAPPRELLAHRVFWSAILLLGFIVALGRGKELWRTLRSWHTMRWLAVSTLLIAINWYVYIYSVLTNQMIQGSLGYFMLPLVSVAVGVFFFGERLRFAQAVALLLSMGGVAIMVAGLGIFPWIALTLAFSFCFYGVVRKHAPVDAMVGLGVETLLLLPLAAGFMMIWLSNGTLVFAHGGAALDGLLVLSGIVTTIPLICFAQAVRRLTLIAVGFMQYISPTIQFLIAVLWFDEAFTPTHQISFALIWAALAIFVVDAVMAVKARNGKPVGLKPLSGEFPSVACRR